MSLAAAVEAKRRQKRKLGEQSQMVEGGGERSPRHERLQRIMTEHYAKGGVVESEPLPEAEEDFLSEEAPKEVDPKEMRRQRLRKIMAGL